jgi:transposase
MRALVNSIFFIAQSGCQWRLLPKEFPPYTTVQRYFYRWRDDGTWQKINHHLVMIAREADGREASPTAGVIDSQSVKTTEAGGPRGFDAGKKIKGRKRHLLTDTAGFLIAGIVHEASIQDRDGAPALLPVDPKCFPLVYVMSSPTVAMPVRNSKRRLPQSAAGPSRSSSDPMSPKALNCCHARWVVERTIAWLNRNRRLAKDFEATIASAEAWLVIASVKLLSRRIARA